MPNAAGSRVGRHRRAVVALAVTGITGAALVAAVTQASPAVARQGGFLLPGNLLVSESTYQGHANTLTEGRTVLPPGCTTDCVVANNDGTYPGVWNNVVVDPSFGITSPITIDQLTPSGRFVNALQVPDRVGGTDLVTSFSSKSELALNLSTDGRSVTFMGYVAPVNGIDVSNSNTPAVIDPTDPVPGVFLRAVGRIDDQGRVQVTETNAYSGNNGRAAILNDSHGRGVYYTAGNAGNGGNPQPAGVITGTGLQLVTPTNRPQREQRPGPTTPLAGFNVTQLGDKADKVGKDTNFRGLTVFDNVLYTTKGSGSNGVNTVYFVDTTGTACPNGVGVPVPGAPLPTTPLDFDPATVQANGLPDNMCVLAGFPTAEKSSTSFPFGIWFADPNTLYVADEGDGDTTFDPATGTYTAAAAQTTAGLQKWVRTNGTWHLADTLTNGLDLGTPYHVPGYPTGDNAVTGLPWAPATDGLRNITGRVNRDGTVTIFAVTSTVSGDGDQGADPNKLVAITDRPTAASAAGERFTAVRSAGFGQVLRGVSFTPGTR
ncbi:MAG TPA: hypothetical protein VFW65_16915 [Pseudonocardiaceae bacterium]|nr:hypothetical protein [Pseudonocardiaceae bacterium]